MLASRVLLRLTTFAVAFACALGFNQAGATDLALKDAVSMAGMQLYLNSGAPSLIIVAVRGDDTVIDAYGETAPGHGVEPAEHSIRSEERRVGKEGVSTCRSRWSQYH